MFRILNPEDVYIDVYTYMDDVMNYVRPMMRCFYENLRQLLFSSSDACFSDPIWHPSSLLGAQLSKLSHVNISYLIS